MKINRLSARQVETVRRDGIYADGAGLYLRVRGNSKCWLFIYHSKGRRRELGLGAPPGVTLARARASAQAAREERADGIDPVEARRALKAIPSFGTISDEWLASREGSVKSDKTVLRWRRTLSAGGYADALRDMRVDEITTDDVLKVLKPIWAKGPTATLARGQIEAVLDSATARGLRRGENPAAWKSRLAHLLPKPVKLARGHHAAMPYADVPAFLADLAGRPETAARCLELVILTACRSSEALNAHVDEVNLADAVWTIPAARMKAGAEHRVPLVGRALEIMTERCAAAGKAGWLFQGYKGQPLSLMALTMISRRMGQTEHTTHGFRSSFRDWAGDETEFPREVAEAALAHTLQGVEASYRRGDALEKRRRLLDAWDAFVTRRLAPTNSNNAEDTAAERAA